MAVSQVTLPLLAFPEGWSAEKDFKAIGHLSSASQRNIEPVGPHFLAHARRKRHKRTFSEDERIQAQHAVKQTEDEDAGELSEPEDPVMLQRDAKDWKVCTFAILICAGHVLTHLKEPRSLRRSGHNQVQVEGH